MEQPSLAFDTDDNDCTQAIKSLLRSQYPPKKAKRKAKSILADNDWEGVQKLIRRTLDSSASPSKEDGEDILEIMQHIHESDPDDNPPHIPLIVWQDNRSTHKASLGRFEAPYNFEVEKVLKAPTIFRLKHATNATALVDMFESNGLRLAGNRKTLPEKMADISTHGLVFCALNMKKEFPSHPQARISRYGAAVIKFKLDPKDRSFYTLGTRYYAQEISQQVLCTSTVDTDWKGLYLGDGFKPNQSADLVPLELKDLKFHLGTSQGTGWYRKDRWVHPEMVLEGDTLIPYEKVKICFVEEHKCLNTADGRHQFCDECRVRYEHRKPSVAWVKRCNLTELNSSRSLCLDFFAMRMVEDPKKWRAIRRIQRNYKIFELDDDSSDNDSASDSDDEEKDGFLRCMEKRVARFDAVYQAAQ